VIARISLLYSSLHACGLERKKCEVLVHVIKIFTREDAIHDALFYTQDAILASFDMC